MKHFYTAILFAGVLIFSNSIHAQTYESWGVTTNGYDYDTIAGYDDTLLFSFNSIIAGGHGDAKIVVYREGDFGDGGEYLEVFEASTISYLGDVQQAAGGDCAPEDSTNVLFDATQIDVWQSGGVLQVKVIASTNVDVGNCAFDRVKVRLVYNYCAFGVPVEYASFSFADDEICNTGGMVSMTGSPAGGTYSGTGVSGSQFNPAGLNPGIYSVTYTATDGIGCVTSASEQIQISSSPQPITETICEGSSPVLNTGQLPHGFFTDLAMTNSLDTTTSFTFPTVTTSPTMYYYAEYNAPMWFMLDSAFGDNVYIIDHETATGDDRGGYAFTDNYVYITGDNNTARYDLDLLNAPVLLPIRDALFSDMQSGKIYSLYNSGSSTMPFNSPASFTVDALVRLDENLEPTTEVIMLDNSFVLSTNSSQNGLFAGYADVIVKSGDNDEVFHIDIATGTVTSLGFFSLDLFWGENFFDYGVAGFDGTDHYIYYRDYSSNIVEHNLTTDAINPVTDFSDVSDMAGFMVNPVNNRLYFHYEGGGQFGGSSETFGYMDAVYTLTDPGLPGTFGCPSAIEFTFNTVDLGPDTTICKEDGYVLEAGLDFVSYTWNGDNNNWNVFPVNTSGTYEVEVTDNVGCTLTDEVVITAEWCSLGSEELSLLNVTVYPVPNNGNFTLDFGTQVSNSTVELIDLQGKVVHAVNEPGSMSQISIETTVVESGMYIVVIHSDQGTVRIPVTIKK